MKYPCNMIQDLLPLYHDGVCSEDSKSIIKDHLSECGVCKSYYDSLCEAEGLIASPTNTERELKKAASLRSVQKKLLRNRILTVFAVLAALIVSFFAVMGVLKSSAGIIEYEDNISVSVTDGSIICRLQGNEANRVQIKRVETDADGETDTYLFFCMYGTKWDGIITSDNVFSEYVLCPADKGAEQIDAVYYYTGDYSDIENMDAEELREVISSSVLLREKQ